MCIRDRWTEDRKKRHSEKMKEYRRKRKKRNKELKLAYGAQMTDKNRKNKQDR